MWLFFIITYYDSFPASFEQDPLLLMDSVH